MDYYNIFKNLLFLLPEETAHELVIHLLKRNLVPARPPRQEYGEILVQNLFGMKFGHPVGLAAGFDKNGAAINGIFNQGFSFIEVGTATPLPQKGNDKPRLFRLTEDMAIINRMGFNNKGIDFLANNIAADRGDRIVGANIGKNKDSADAIADYIIALEKVFASASYVTINISSPNTPDLRDLQQKKNLGELLSSINKKRAELSKSQGKNTPIFMKISPDLTIDELEDVVENAASYKIDGLVVSNTTVQRPNWLRSKKASQGGGMSGKPLLSYSTEIMKNAYRLAGGKIPIIGVGGIFSGEDAYAKIRAGASLLQIYTAVIYKGFGVVDEINARLVELLKRDGFSHISQAIGADAK